MEREIRRGRVRERVTERDKEGEGRGLSQLHVYTEDTNPHVHVYKYITSGKEEEGKEMTCTCTHIVPDSGKGIKQVNGSIPLIIQHLQTVEKIITSEHIIGYNQCS